MGGEGVLLVRCVVEREGLRLRIGGVKTRVLPGMGGGPTVDARTPRRKGTGSERTCMLVGRFSVWPFVCACAVMDGERWGGATRPGTGIKTVCQRACESVALGALPGLSHQTPNLA